MIPNIGVFDVILSIAILFVVYLIAIRWKNKQIVEHKEYKWFILTLSIKVIAAISFVLISIFYYKEGDTFLYFEIAEDLRLHLYEDYKETLETLFTSYGNLENVSYHPLRKYNYYYERSSSWFFSRIVFLFNLFSMGSFLCCTILMSVFSFIGLWSGYRTMATLFSNVKGLLLIPFFFIPTALIWSSGILKDTFLICLIGLFLYAFFNLIKYKTKIIISLLIMVCCFYFFLHLKPILLFSLVPVFFLLGIVLLTKPIESIKYRLIIRFASVLLVVLSFSLINNKLVSPSSKYKFENIYTTLKGYQTFHSMDVFAEGQSRYTLGNTEYSVSGMIKKIPAAVNVTYFRPYLWESNRVSMILGSIESAVLLLVVLLLLFVLKNKVFKTIYKSPELIFFIGFSLIYAFIVGLSSYNFGALSRYKIPAILFLILAIVIIISKNEKQLAPTKFNSLLNF